MQTATTPVPAAVAWLFRLPTGLCWLLARAWCLLLGARLGRALRSALGGSPLPTTVGPPVRPRRPRRPGQGARGQATLPYPNAA